MTETKIKVIKIGGSLISEASRFRSILNIYSNYKNDKVLTVISAFGKTTRNLISCAKYAAKGDSEKAFQTLRNIIFFHHDIIDKGFADPNNISCIKDKINNSFDNLNKFIDGINITRELSSRTLDIVMSYGEDTALKILHSYLNENGIEVKYLDSTEIIVSDSNFGCAKPDLIKTAENVNSIVLPLFNDNDYIITQGFTAKDINGITTTMGMESSNLTATIYASLLNSSELTIWSDVDGIKTADPRIIKGSKTVKIMDYETASNAAANGLKLLYPQMIDVARDNNISIKIRSAITNDAENFTEICSESESVSPMLIVHNNIEFKQSYSGDVKSDKKFISEFILPYNKVALYKSSEPNGNFSEKYDFIILLNITKENLIRTELLKKLSLSDNIKSVYILPQSSFYEIYVVADYDLIKELIEPIFS